MAIYGYVMAAATDAALARERLYYGCHASQERIFMSVLPTAPQSPSSLLPRALPTLDSANSVDSVYSKTSVVTNTISNTHCFMLQIKYV